MKKSVDKDSVKHFDEKDKLTDFVEELPVFEEDSSCSQQNHKRNQIGRFSLGLLQR